MNARDWNAYLFAPAVVVGDPDVQCDTRVVGDAEPVAPRIAPTPTPQCALQPQAHAPAPVASARAAARRAWQLTATPADDATCLLH